MNYDFPSTVLRSSSERIEERPYGTYLVRESSYIVRRPGADGKDSAPVRCASYRSSPYLDGGDI